MSKKSSRWAVVLDFDGTITRKPEQSVFHLIRRHAGLSQKALNEMEEINKQYFPAHVAGTMTQDDEIKLLFREVNIWLSDCLSPAQAAEAMSQAKIRPQVINCLTWLKERNIPVAVVSYGIRQFIQMILLYKGLDGLIDKVYALNLTVNPKYGSYDGFLTNSAVIPSNKGMWSRDFARLHRISYGNILAVGDSWGDWGIGHLKQNRLGLALDKKDANLLQPHFGEVVITDSFLPAWQWMRKKIR